MKKILAVLSLSLAFIFPAMAQTPSAPNHRLTFYIETPINQKNPDDPILKEFRVEFEKYVRAADKDAQIQEQQPEVNDPDGPVIVVLSQDVAAANDKGEGATDAVSIILTFHTQGKVYSAYMGSAAATFGMDKVDSYSDAAADMLAEAAVDYLTPASSESPNKKQSVPVYAEPDEGKA